MAKQRTLRELLTTYHQSREQTESLAKQSWTLALDMIENAVRRLNTLSVPAADTASDTVNTTIHPQAQLVLNYMNTLQQKWILMFYSANNPGNTTFFTSSDNVGMFKLCRRDVSKQPNSEVVFYDYKADEAGDIVNGLLEDGHGCSHILAEREQIRQLVLYRDELRVMGDRGNSPLVRHRVIAGI